MKSSARETMQLALENIRLLETLLSTEEARHHDEKHEHQVDLYRAAIQTLFNVKKYLLGIKNGFRQYEVDCHETYALPYWDITPLKDDYSQ